MDVDGLKVANSEPKGITDSRDDRHDKDRRHERVARAGKLYAGRCDLD